MKKNKKFLFATTLLSLSAIPVATISVIKSINLNENQISKTSEDTQAVTNPTNTITFQLKKDYQSLSWYNKEFSNSITEDQLKELILPSLKFDVNYGILIETPTQSNGALTNGYVNFAIYIRNNEISDGVPTAPSDGQSDNFKFIEAPNKIEYSDGSSSSINMHAYTTTTTDTESIDSNSVTINGVSIGKKYVWTTKNIENLFLPYKYSFSWNSNDKIGDFLKSTSKQAPENTSSQDNDTNSKYLTAQDVYDNMIATSSITDLLPDDTISKAISISSTDLSAYGISNEDASNYGIALITIDFNNSDKGKEANSWANNKVPSEKYLVRGLSNSSGNKEEMRLNISSNSNTFLNTSFSVSKVKEQNSNFTLPQGINGDSFKISDLTPTQLINTLVTNQNGSSNLLNLLATKTYLSDNSQSPAIYLTYMGKNQYSTKDSKETTSNTTTSSSWYGTGLNEQGSIYSRTNGVISSTKDQNAATSSQITAISASSDDSTGTLYLKITYNNYDVYDNVEDMGLTTSLVITGMKKTNSSSTNDLYVQWKTVDQLLFTSSSYVNNLYDKHKNDSSYLKSLSNMFFIGTSNTYNLDRNVNISTNGNNLTITLIFTSFGDCYYTDSNGVVKQGLQISNTFNMSSSQNAYDSGITFTDSSKIQSSIANYSSYTPQELIDAISSGKISIDSFVSTNNGNYTYSKVVTSNDTNDGIVVEVTATSITRDVTTSYTYAEIYNGLSTGASSSYVYNFAFSDSSSTQLKEGLTKLEAIPFDEITAQNVFDYYVSNLPIYNGTFKIELTVNDITITKNSDNTITVKIVIPNYNSSDETATEESRTFTTKLNGFVELEKHNNNSNKNNKDLTIPLSAGFASGIVLLMSAILVHLIIKRKKLSKSKISLKDMRNSQKTKN